MDFYNNIKKFLGIPNYNNNLRDKREDSNEESLDEYEKFGFNVFSNPLEMHRYFEHQMNEILKSFGMFNNDSSFFGNNEDSFFGGAFNEPNFGFSQFPEDKDVRDNPAEGNLRNQFLKPGYEEPSTHLQKKTDSDLDREYKTGNLDKMLQPKSPQRRSPNFSFGQSMTSQIMRNIDGMIETQRTVQDQQGNREVTVTRKRGDKEYTITTRTDKNGSQEVTENFINIDKSEKDSFFKNDSLPKQIRDGNKSPGDSLFDKFFK